MAATRHSEHGIGLAAGDVTAIVRPDLGARISSLTIGGTELLVTDADRPVDWGLYPMAPFAGRLRHGRVEFGGSVHQLPLTLPPHAIHGTLVTRAWDVVTDGVMEVELRDPWPYRGRVRHTVDLQEDHLALELTVEADEPMPAWAGWHPWFRRDIGIAGAPAEVDFTAGAMYERDGEGVPTGATVAPPPGPWDDCFTKLSGPPRVVWPGWLELTVESPHEYPVVYTEPPHAVCVEPQTAPPDALNLGMAAVLEPGKPLVATMALRWRRLD